MDIYRGILRQQTGRGMLGNVLGLFGRSLVPILKKEARKIAPKLLKTGVGVLSDVATRKRSFKEAARSRGKTLIGEVIKPPTRKRKRQSVTGPRKKQKLARRQKDIFD